MSRFAIGFVSPRNIDVEQMNLVVARDPLPGIVVDQAGGRDALASSSCGSSAAQELLHWTGAIALRHRALIGIVTAHE